MQLDLYVWDFKIVEVPESVLTPYTFLKEFNGAPKEFQRFPETFYKLEVLR